MPIGAQRLPEYDIMRQRVSQRSDRSRQGGQDALKRRFAALGAINSGSHIKQQQIQEDQAQRNKEDALANVDMGEAQELGRRDEIQKNRDFQSSENLKNRTFQSDESAKQRSFQGEHMEKDRAFQKEVFSFSKESKLKELDLAKQDLELRRSESDFNREMGKHQMKNSGGLFGAGGFMGLGF